MALYPADCGGVSRAFHSAVGFGSRLLLLGGAQNPDGSQADCDVRILDTYSLQWEQKDCSGDSPASKSRAAITMHGDTLVVFGGSDLQTELWMLDTVKYSWSLQECSGKIPDGRMDGQLFVVANKMLLIGGTNGRRNLPDVSQLDFNTMTWWQPRCRGDSPSGTRFPVTMFRNKLYLFGGRDSASFTLDNLYVLDLEQMVWTMSHINGETPPARAGAAMCCLEGVIYCIGGSAGKVGGKPLNDIWKFDVSAKTWSRLKEPGEPISPRTGHCATPVGNKIFIVGGHDNTRVHNDCWVLDMETKRWIEISFEEMRKVPKPRVGPTLMGFGHKVLMFGGVARGKVQGELKYFDADDQDWHKPKTHGRGPTDRVGHAWTKRGRNIYLFGGTDLHSIDDRVHVLDVEKWSWSKPKIGGDKPGGQIGHTLTAVGDQVFLFGGHSKRFGYTNDTYILYLRPPIEWMKASTTGTLPSPRCGHSMVRVGTELWCFGGGASGLAFNDIFAFDCERLEWRVLTMPAQATPCPRYGHSAVLMGQNMVVFGGLTNGKFGSELLNDLWSLDSSTLIWSSVRVTGQVPSARFRHGCCVIENLMVLWGGVGGGGDLTMLKTSDEYVDESDIITISSSVARGNVAAGNSKEDISAWLAQLGLQRLQKVFTNAEIHTVHDVMHLNDDDLKSIGVDSVGPRKRILAAIQALQAGGGVPTAGAGDALGPAMEPSPFSATPTVAIGGPLGGGGPTVTQRVGQDRYDSVRTQTASGNVQAGQVYFNRFRVSDRTVQLGGSSVVYIAHDIKTNKPVALKFVSNREDFFNEVNFLKMLRSDYVADMIDYVEDAGNRAHCVVLEAAEFSLAEHLKNNKHLDRNERKYLIERVARIVKYMHDHNVVHGDLKPENIMMFAGMQWKVVDLELARQVGHLMSPKVSLAYTSPEYARKIQAKQQRDARASLTMDCWSAGLVFYEIFASRPLLSDRRDILAAVASVEDLDIPWGNIEDEQARELIAVLLVKEADHRANIDYVLHHAYLAGGLTTRQMTETFETLQAQQERLQSLLKQVLKYVKT